MEEVKEGVRDCLRIPGTPLTGQLKFLTLKTATHPTILGGSQRARVPRKIQVGQGRVKCGIGCQCPA